MATVNRNPKTEALLQELVEEGIASYEASNQRITKVILTLGRKTHVINTCEYSTEDFESMYEHVRLYITKESKTNKERDMYRGMAFDLSPSALGVLEEAYDGTKNVRTYVKQSSQDGKTIMKTLLDDVFNEKKISIRLFNSIARSISGKTGAVLVGNWYITPCSLEEVLMKEYNRTRAEAKAEVRAYLEKIAA